MKDKIIDWIICRLFSWYLFYVYRKKLSLKKVNRLDQWIWNRYFAEDFQSYVERNT